MPVQYITIAFLLGASFVCPAKVDPVRAIHGNANFAIYYEANLQDCGYLTTLD